MAKTKRRPRAQAPPPEEPVVPPEERASERTRLITAAVVVASIAATGLLLSGWTPGPGAPKPARVAASPAPTTPAAPATKKKTVKPKVRKRAQSVPLTTRQISKQLFQGECGFCHTLAAAGTSGRVGPNLDKLRPTRKRVLEAIAAGGRRTGLMPADIFTGSDALNVATFVAEAARR
jgi:mono/diheme cytochrome c family protein